MGAGDSRGIAPVGSLAYRNRAILQDDLLDYDLVLNRIHRHTAHADANHGEDFANGDSPCPLFARPCSINMAFSGRAARRMACLPNLAAIWSATRSNC